MSFAAALWALPLSAGEPITGHARVVDGDGVRISGVSIRLAGIDAPERGQTCRPANGTVFDCGEAMRAALARDIQGKRLSCLDEGERSHNRVVARCSLDGVDLGASLIAAGRARAHPKFASSAYFQIEQDAARAGRGLWAFEMESPWKYRADQRSAQSKRATVADSDCRVKGNVSSRGIKIYHAPGQRDYAKVRISVNKGERCFKTEAHAHAAGWRRALR